MAINPVDFRFNGQQSYSPLLTALAEAPANKIKLGIAQEKNQRERLSSLLTNMSSAAAIARQVQLQNATKKMSQLAGGPNSVGGNAAMISPEGFSAVAGQLPATMMGLNAAFPSVQPQGAQPAQAATQSATPGSVPLSNDEGVLSPDMIRNKLVMKTLMGEPKPVTDPNTGVPYDSYGPGMNFPTFGSKDYTGQSGTPQLPPKLNDAVNTAKKDFQSRPDVTTNVGNLNLLDQLEKAVRENNPSSVQNIKAGRMESGGIPGGRASSAAMAGEFGSKAYGAQMGRLWEQAWTGKLDTTDQKQFLQQIATQRNVSAKQLIDANASTSSDISKQYGIAPGLAKKIIGQGMEPLFNKYDPNLKSVPVSTDDVQVGEVYNGYRYKGGDKTKQSSWVKPK